MAKKIIIDAGHGGEDLGYSGNSIIEKDFALDISRYIYDKLKNNGVEVSLSRDEDITLSPSERVEKILNTYGNSNDVIVISNHVNSGGGDGAEIIYALRNNNILPNLIKEELEDAGQNVNKVYQLRWPTDTSKDYYFIHRDTGKVQPIMIEYGFVDSYGDDVTQLKNEWQKLGDAVANALLEYIGKAPIEGYYIVLPGDSLWSIASKYDTTVDEIKKLNNLVSNNLSIGQRLKLPEKKEVTEENIYIVKSGDSLYSISQRYNTTINEIMRLNNLSSSVLTVGQQIRIPSGASTPTDKNYEQYTVKSGDSLWNIAKKYGISLDELLVTNNLSSSSTLRIGQILKIPLKKSETENNQYILYTVQRGDTLWEIANKYNKTVQELMDYNGLKNNLLDVGQQIKIPISKEPDNQIIYTVKSGDSLWNIANKYNVTVDEIKRKNNLTSNNLTIGQQLII